MTTGFEVENGKLTGFTVPSGVEGYFRVVLPESVTSIAAGAFNAKDNASFSKNFLSIEIPNSVTAIEAGAFVDCKKLVEVCFANENGIGVGDSGLYLNALSRIGSASERSLHTEEHGGAEYLFVREGEATSTEWVLLDYAGALTSLTLPAPSVCDSACTSYSVYDDAFAGSALTSLVIPQGVSYVGERAFSGCALTSVTFHEGLEEIGAQAFDNAKVASLAFPASLNTIGDHAFENCKSLSDVSFAKRETGVTVDRYAFASCSALRKIDLPAKTTVRQYAFNGCSALMWVYAESGTQFINTAAGEVDDATFFPLNTNLSVIFSSKAEYERVMNAPQGETFKNNHGDAATYFVDVNCYIGGGEEPVVYRRLHGEQFNYVQDERAGVWNTDTAFNALPVQAAHYASTVWYKQKELTESVSWAQVNELLDAESEINLYCYRTVEAPVLPQEPATWVASDKISYDITNLSEVLTALGNTREYEADQLSALEFAVTYADEQGNVKESPASISGQRFRFAQCKVRGLVVAGCFHHHDQRRYGFL